jgi:formate dehydrogenase subunit delta
MNIHHLVSMANDISAFFNAEVGEQDAHKSVALHISRYWDPRMREQIIAHANAGGDGLCKAALDAVRTLPPPPRRDQGTASR